jgi:hypothetical protein
MWLLALSLALPIAPASNPRLVELEACRVGLTEMGRTAAFYASAIYQAQMDGNGRVIRVKALLVPEFFPHLVDTGAFESCLRRWRFSGGGRVTVIFSAGTTGDVATGWWISVGSAEHSMTLRLTGG